MASTRGPGPCLLSNSLLETTAGARRIILCKTRSKLITEYALRDVAKPIGVARCVTQLVQSLPDNLKGVLPSPEQIAAELKARGRQ